MSRSPASQPQFITARDNPLLKDIRRLVRDNAAWRSLQRVWLEGDHLCRAALQRGLQPEVAVFAESAWPGARELTGGLPLRCARTVVLPDALMRGLGALESPAPMGFVLPLPPRPALQPAVPTVVLDRLQDAGNVGSILRSASAFGVRQVLALGGTAALWGSKVLRAGMGAHFALALLESATLDDVRRLQVPLLLTSSHQGQLLHRCRLPAPCAWVLGHEGQGASAALQELATMHVRIAQPGGEESLNVAAAAAICLHASATQQET